MYCQNCGTKLADGTNFCFVCGKPYNGKEERLTYYLNLDVAYITGIAPISHCIINTNDESTAKILYKDMKEKFNDENKLSIEKIEYSWWAKYNITKYASFGTGESIRKEGLHIYDYLMNDGWREVPGSRVLGNKFIGYQFIKEGIKNISE